MAYTIIWNGNRTGIYVSDKKVSIEFIRQFEPSAQPTDIFKFEEIIEKKSEYKKVKTIADIKSDPRIDHFEYRYDGYNVHMVVCKDEFKFEGERTCEIGNIKQICDSINFNLEKD